MYEVKIILESISNGHVNPGDVVAKTGLPRYEVLAVFHLLEGLGLIETIYARGSHKVYRLTRKGMDILEGLESGYKMEVIVNKNSVEQTNSI
jgi:predicted transcriptional regulator